MDVKYLLQMPDKKRRQYLFVAIDRATRWVYLEVLKDKTAQSSERFMRRLLKAAPFKITHQLTDNGKEFTDHFCATGERQATGRHLLDRLCHTEGIEHRLTPPRHPQTNGMVERFNGRISEVLTTTQFDSAQSLEQTLTRYVKLYNHSIPQRALGHVTPIQTMKSRYDEQPELLRKRIHNQTGLDN